MQAFYVLEVFRSGTQRPGRPAPYRWRLRCRRNGKIVATAGESFCGRRGALRAAGRLVSVLAGGRGNVETR